MARSFFNINMYFLILRVLFFNINMYFLILCVPFFKLIIFFKYFLKIKSFKFEKV